MHEREGARVMNDELG